MNDKEKNPIATLAQAEDVLKYLEYGRQNGYELGVMTKAYVDRLDDIIHHIKMRLYRGKFRGPQS